MFKLTIFEKDEPLMAAASSVLRDWPDGPALMLCNSTNGLVQLASDVVIINGAGEIAVGELPMSALRATIDRFIGGDLKMVIAANRIWREELTLGLQELISGHASMPKRMLLILAGEELNEFMVPPVVEAITADRNIFVMAYSKDLSDALTANKMGAAIGAETLLVAEDSILNVTAVFDDGSIIAEVCDQGCWMSFCGSTELTREQAAALPKIEPRAVCGDCVDRPACGLRSN